MSQRVVSVLKRKQCVLCAVRVCQAFQTLSEQTEVWCTFSGGKRADDAHATACEITRECCARVVNV